MINAASDLGIVAYPTLPSDEPELFRVANVNPGSMNLEWKAGNARVRLVTYITA